MEIEGASLYQMNKQLSANEKIMGAAARKRIWDVVRHWFRDSIDTYAMLLCHELRDYTVFRVVNSPADAADALFECIDNRGNLISIEPAEGGALEIWIREVTGVTEDGFNEIEEDYCYYLFCYDSAIIDC